MRRMNSSYSTFPDGDSNAGGGCGDGNRNGNGDNERQQQHQHQETELSILSSPFEPSSPGHIQAQAQVQAQIQIQDPPPDPTSVEIAFVKLVFYMLGIGFLLPWNAFISAETYFMSRFTKSTCVGVGVDLGDNGLGVNDDGVNGDGDSSYSQSHNDYDNTFIERFLFSSSSDSSYSSSISSSYNNQGDDGGNGDGNGSGDSDDSATNAGSNFMSWLGLLYNLSGVLALVFLLLQERAKEIQQQQQQQQQQQSNNDNDIDTNGDCDEERGGREEKEKENDKNHSQHQRYPPNKLESNSTTTTTTTTRIDSFSDNANTDIDTNTNTNTNTDANTNNNDTNNANNASSSSSSSKQKQTVITSFIINLLIMTLTSSLVLIPSFNNSSYTIHLFEIITYVTIISYGTVGAFLSTAILSYANTFFKYYTDVSVQCFISGQAVGGVVISILNLVLGYVVNGGGGGEGRETGYWDENCDVVDGNLIMNGENDYHSNQDGGERSLLMLLLSLSSLPSRPGMFLETTTSTLATTLTTTCHKYNIDWGAFSYFTVCCIFLLLCIVLYVMLDAHPVLNYYRYYCCGAGAGVGAGADASNSGSNSNDNNNNVNSKGCPAVQEQNQFPSSSSSSAAIHNTAGDGGEIKMEDNIHCNGEEFISSRTMTNNSELTSLWTGELEEKDDNAVLVFGQQRKKNKKKKKDERRKRRYNYFQKSHENDNRNDNHNFMALQESNGEGRTEQQQRTEYQEQVSLMEPLLQVHGEIEDQNDTHNNSNNSSNITLFVWKSIQLPIISIFLTFCITLTLFPSWTGKLQSALQCQSGSSRFRNDLFIPLMIVLFNVFDLFGRMSSGFVMTHALQSKKSRNIDHNNSDSDDNDRQAQDQQQSSSLQVISKKITFLSIIRIIFLPAFLLCKTDNPSHSDELFYNESQSSSGSDTYTISLMILFAFSNGLVSTLSFIHAAALIPTSNSLSNSDDGTTSEVDNKKNGHDDDTIQKVASTLLNFAVGIGLLFGSLFSFVYNYIGEGF